MKILQKEDEIIKSDEKIIQNLEENLNTPQKKYNKEYSEKKKKKFTFKNKFSSNGYEGFNSR